MTKRLSNKDRLEELDLTKDKTSKTWNGPDRRKAINSCIDPYHERRKPKRR
jgi:hypothetical protein